MTSVIRPLRGREYGLVVLALVIAAGCIRLGFWQLHRLSERRAQNAIVASRLAEPAVGIDAIPRDSARQRDLHVHVHGLYDYAHEIVLTSRSRQGSPGVNIITPIRVAGNDTAVLINRGWIYAPDGVRADLSQWREGDSLDATGYVVPFEGREGTSHSPSRANAYRWLDTALARQAFPYPVRPYFVILPKDANTAGGILPRIPPPELDEGPHLSYAIQWFAFATIALGGIFFFVRRSGEASDVLPLL